MNDPFKVIIVDDDPGNLAETIKDLEKIENVFLMKILKKSLEIPDYLGKNKADLIFLGLEKDEKISFNLAKEMRKKEISSEIVFVSEVNDYGQEAFEVQASGFLLKPLECEGVLKEIQKAKIRKNEEYLDF